jgi:hypothetical protein
VIGPSQRPQPDNKQHLQETDIRAPDGIRTRNISKRAAADARLKLCSHLDRMMIMTDDDDDDDNNNNNNNAQFWRRTNA